MKQESAATALVATGRDVELIARRSILFQLSVPPSGRLFSVCHRRSSVIEEALAKIIFGGGSGFSLTGRSMLTQQDRPRSMERVLN